jgi:spore germination cell wall hydrolase CwlJ-like protein
MSPSHVIQALAFSPSRLLRDHPRETVALGALAFAAAVALGGVAYSSVPPDVAASVRGQQAAPPAPPPMIVRNLAPQDAVSVNQAIPLSDSPNPAAQPFSWRSASEVSRARALDCLTSAVYYEAANESIDGQRAVAQVVLNRLRHPAFPASVCGVVYEGSTRATGCQFTFTCDGSLARRPNPGLWDRARKVAAASLSGFVYAPVGHATHYHANYVVPYWASSLAKNAVVGAHIFYRWAGSWGRPAAFDMRYAAVEPDSAALRSAALAAEARQPEPAPTTQAELAEAIAQIPGAEAQPAKGGRQTVRFSLAAREAVEKATEKTVRRDYVENFDASGNLRWALGGSSTESSDKPLGKSAPAAAAGAGAGAGTGGAAPIK